MSTAATLSRVRVHYHGGEDWTPQHPVSFDLRDGRTTLLIGPSGCGKSTLTLTVDGLVPHCVPSDYSGSVQVLGTEVADAGITDLATRVALVMQDPDAQIVTRSVWEEVCYALENLCLPIDEVDRRATKALETLGITHLAALDPWTLSGGQRQRVVLAAALAQEPKILVLDEPTANLDPAAAEDFHALLPGLAASGTAILIVEHNLDHIVAAVDHVVALDRAGQVLSEGPTRKVLIDDAHLLAGAGIRLPSAVRLGHALALSPAPLTIDEAARTVAAHHGTPCAPPPVPPVARATTGREVVLRASGLAVRRAGHEVLSGVDLELHDGEILAIIGANGSGKSTLLRTLVGVQKLSAGRIQVDALGRHRPSGTCTLVTQNPEHQFVEGSVRAELAHCLRLRRSPDAQVEQVVAELLEDYGLVEHAERNPFTLSGGQKRRLSVAAALSVPRRVLLLDEPTFGQDQVNADRLMGRLRHLADSGCAVALATHDLEVAGQYADQALVLAAGSVAAVGPVEQILAEEDLITRVGLRISSLTRIALSAQALGATVPTWTSWADVERPVLTGVGEEAYR